jgi:hypothetical protein
MSSCAQLALVGECGIGGICVDGECQCGSTWAQSLEFAGEARQVCLADPTLLRALWGACGALVVIALLVQLKVAYDVGSIARKLPALVGTLQGLLCCLYRLASGAEFGVSVIFTLLVGLLETLFILVAGVFLSKYANYLRQTMASFETSLKKSASPFIIFSERITSVHLVLDLCGVLVFVAATIVPTSRPVLVRAGWLYFGLSKAFTGWLFYSTLKAFAVDIDSFIDFAQVSIEGGSSVGGTAFVAEVVTRLRRLLRSVKSVQRGTVAYHCAVVPVILVCSIWPSYTPWLMYYLPASYTLLLAVFAGSTGVLYLRSKERNGKRLTSKSRSSGSSLVAPVPSQSALKAGNFPADVSAH